MIVNVEEAKKPSAAQYKPERKLIRLVSADEKFISSSCLRWNDFVSFEDCEIEEAYQ